MPLRGSRVIGLDISAAMLADAKRRETGTCIQGDALDLVAFLAPGVAVTPGRVHRYGGQTTVILLRSHENGC